MNSCLFACKVMHQRLHPKRHRFAYGTLMAYLDLDELPDLPRQIKGFALNQPAPFAFYECDHLKVEDPELRALPLKDRVHRVLLQQFGVVLPPQGRITLLTNLRTLGYVFNPVSFFFCWGDDLTPVCVLVQVGNTFHEQKLYWVGPDVNAIHHPSPLPKGEGTIRMYRSQPVKEFYVSPFGQLQDHFDFKITLPDPSPGKASHPQQLAIFVDSITPQEHTPVLVTSLTGQAMALENWGLLMMGLRYPLSTLMVIARIHYQAFLLFIKGLPFFKKQHMPQHQTQVLNPHPSLTRHR